MYSNCKESSTPTKFNDTMLENEAVFCKSAGSINAKHTPRHFQPNILTNRNSIQPLRQYYKPTYHPPSMSQSTVVSPRMQNRDDVENSFYRNSSIFTSSDGVIHISLRHGIQIDVTVDNSFRLTTNAGQIVIALSNTGQESAIKHTNGMVLQFDNTVQIVTNDQSQNPENARYATMSGNDIAFTNGVLVEMESFTLDSIGTRQSNNHFTKLTHDNTSAVFFGKSKHGPGCNEEALHFIRKASVKKCTDDGMDVITINDFRIWQMKDGLVTVARMSLPFKIRASPMNSSFTLSTSHIHCTASSQHSSHLFVRSQDQSMHYDGKNFVVRYNGNSAGFDKNDFLFVY
ncbi:hypothetical protein HA402_004527 [Bradysia odoriphaga]|nr:hypothetical protein HA402_004527 [Bradysia odoriphaga]